MTQTQRNLGLFAGVALLFILTGVFQSWNLSLQILNIGILSAIMALGVNMQWGYAGLFSTGIVGSVALGGLAVVLVSARPVPEAFAAGGWMTLGGLAIGVGVIVAATLLRKHSFRRLGSLFSRLVVAPLHSKVTMLDEREVCGRFVGLSAATFIDQRVPDALYVSPITTALVG